MGKVVDGFVIGCECIDVTDSSLIMLPLRIRAIITYGRCPGPMADADSSDILCS